MFWYALRFLVSWVLLVMAVFALVHWPAWAGRRLHPSQGHDAPGPCGRPGSLSADGRAAAGQILAERSARGEIDDDESWQRMTTLRAGRPDDSAAADR